MGSLERQVAQQRGRRKLDAMKRRTGQLRRRVVATAALGFVLLWTVVFVQMATGNDPALGTGTTSLAVKKKRASELERRRRQAAVAPPSEEEVESAPVEEPETSEAAAIEAEQIEAARVETEQREIEAQELAEAEARELEELETVTTGQS
jgi:hypothetical protein